MNGLRQDQRNSAKAPFTEKCAIETKDKQTIISLGEIEKQTITVPVKCQDTATTNLNKVINTARSFFG